jgi:glucokinase
LHGEPFFAVDVGASAVKSGIVLDGAAQEVAREPVAQGLDGLVRQLVRLFQGANASAWGLCIAGLVDADAGTLRYSANLGLKDAPLVELLSAELPPPLVFANDLDAAAVGEADGGTLALIQVGTGIAGRYVVEGRVVPSASGHGGEVGHLRFRAGGRECSCGKRGCAEAYGGWRGIASRYAEAGRTTPEPSTLPAGDDWERQVLAEALEAIGFAASALVATCDPGTLRVGGGVAAALGETLLEAIRSSLAEQVLPDVAAATVVEAARSGDAAPLRGLYELATRSVR